MPPLASINESRLYDFVNGSPRPGNELGSKMGWGVANSSSLYRVEGWGAPYFHINGQGNMAVRPHGLAKDPSEEIDLMEAIQKVVDSGCGGGLNLPLIIRFPDMLKHRLASLQDAFDRCIELRKYQGRFQGVFPVKCNPDRYVVEDIVRFGRQFHFGLEAGSKPELMLVIASMCKSSPEALLICNGYKDAEYVQLALTSRQLGLNTVIVLEQEEELDIILKLSQRLSVQPVIGIRTKLSTKHAGHWGETSGEKGKFGLSTSEVVGVVKKLRRVGMLDCLQLLHFHIGSQIPSLSIVEEGVSEAAQIFCELSLLGANMKIIDIGGGLGVDYDGSNSAASDMSIGYSIEEYADQVVEAVMDACLQKNVKQPTLCCESGRALVSHHSVLVFDVLSAHKRAGNVAEDLGIPLECEGLPEAMAAIHENFVACVRVGNYEGALAHSKHLKAECTRLFKLGLLNLELRATIDKMFEVFSVLVDENENHNVPSILMSVKSALGCADLTENHKMSSVEISGKSGPGSVDQSGCGDRGEKWKSGSDYLATYHINLSIFKSMPDSWAIGQLFPIVPLHRLDEEPCVRAILSDLTCDSDGKVATFIGKDHFGEQAKHLRVHELEPEKPYYMGMFLGGAYQEVLGSMHNLFGTPNVVHVVLSRGPDGFQIARIVPGQTVAGVLRVMQHEPLEIFEDLKCRVADALHEGRFASDHEARCVLQSLAGNLSSYTYLSSDSKSCSFSLNKTRMYSPLEHSYIVK